MISYDLLVDPAQMLEVTLREDAKTTTTIAAITCRFVPVSGPTGSKQIAIEVLWDSANQHPAQPYYCPEAAVTRLLVPPDRIVHVRPYR